MGERQDHFVECSYSRLRCPNECKDDRGVVKYLYRCNLTQHMLKCPNRKHECEDCGQVGTYASITQDHRDVCPGRPVPCPQGCRGDDGAVKHFSRGTLDEHLTLHCANREYKCQDCGENGTYASITQEHSKVCRTCQHCGEKGITSVHFEKCQKYPIPCPNAGCESTVQRKGMKKHREANCMFEEFPCKYARLGCNTRKRRGSLSAHEHEDQLHLHMAIDTVEWLEKELRSLKSRKSTTLKSGESVIFMMPSYQRRKENDEIFTSPPFPLSSGHDLSIQIYANGMGSSKGKHVSVVTQLLKSESQQGELLKPFNGSISIQLLNQLADENHHVNCKESNKASQNIPNFILHSKLNGSKKTEYLKDDTLYFKVTVHISDSKSWLECTH